MPKIKTHDQNTKNKQILMKIDPQLAREMKELSEQLGAGTQDVLATLVWMAKKAMGRRITIESKEESKSITIRTFETLPKTSPITPNVK